MSSSIGEACDSFTWPTNVKQTIKPPIIDECPHELLFRQYALIKDCPRVVVPLCGNSYDMRYLYDMGHHVQGIDKCEASVVQFFDDNKDLKVRITEEDGSKVYSSQDGRLKVLVADILDIKGCSLDYEFDAIWDRAAFGYIEPRMRIYYVQRLKKFLKADFVMLMAVYEHDENVLPYSITRDMLVMSFGDKAVVSPRYIDTEVQETFCFEGQSSRPFPRNIAERLYSLVSFNETLERSAA